MIIADKLAVAATFSSQSASFGEIIGIMLRFRGVLSITGQQVCVYEVCGRVNNSTNLNFVELHDNHFIYYYMLFSNCVN